MEMSVGTIVTIVLLMSVLVLGLVMIKNIFSGGINVTKMTIDQLNSKAAEIFGNTDQTVLIIPTLAELTIKPGKSDAFAVSIRNIANNVDSGTSFSYEVTPEENSCGYTNEQTMALISLGSKQSLDVAISGIESSKILFNIPSNAPDCQISYRIKVLKGTNLYANPQIIVKTSNNAN